MQDDEMQKRILRAEWEIEALKDGHEKQVAAMTSLGSRMDTQFKQIMEAISALRNESIREEGAAQERLKAEQSRRDRAKWVSVAVGALGVLGGLGLWRGADAATIKYDAPPFIQQSTREDS